MRSSAAAIWPAILFLLVGAFAGGVETGARFPHVVVGLAAVAATALAGARELADPLRLGPAARWLLPALVVSAVASGFVSPVPRAGLVGLLVLPALLLLPAATARLVSAARARRIAVAAWGAALAAIAGWAFAANGWRADLSAGVPAGDPGLLAALVVTGLPIAALGWRERGAPRWIAAAATVSGVLVVATTRSTPGALGLALACALTARHAGSARHLLLGTALLAAASVVPDLEASLRGEAATGRMRWEAARGDWRGALERPSLGWGPGSAAWTEAAFRRPLPGSGEIAGGLGAPRPLASLVAFELGLPALTLVAAIGFAFVRRRRLAAPHDPGLTLAAGAALAAGCVATAADAWLAAPALPTALALAAGFLFAGEGSPARPAGGFAVGIVVAYLVALGWIARPLVGAGRLYEDARDERNSGRRTRFLAAAVARDPHFPLYRARLAWSGAAGREGAGWRTSLDAAFAARGVAPLWLRAAERAARAGRRQDARRAAERAMALAPLSAPAPFLLHVLTPGDVDCAARALLAEPRLAAAVRWRGHERERREVLVRVGRWRGVDTRWKEVFLRQARAAAPGDGAELALVTRFDESARDSISLRVFRRSPWPSAVARWSVDRAAARRVRVPPATATASSSREAFPVGSCASAPVD